jgi:putative ABC transport system substrate-binding protein
MKKIKVFLLTALLVSGFFGCFGKAKTGTDIIAKNNLAQKNLLIAIVTDTQEEFAAGIQAGFKEAMDKLLAREGATAMYEVFDTQLNEANSGQIIADIQAKPFDLICTINYPTVFADTNIAMKLDPAKYKIISENCIPLQSGVAQSWNKPGKNITGVGIFVQLNSLIRLVKTLDPRKKRLVMYSWDAMGPVNDWLKEEAQKACKEEGFELAEFRLVSNQEQEFSFLAEYSAKSEDYCILVGISAFVHEDGTPAFSKATATYVRENSQLMNISYDEIDVKEGFLAGTCVVWNDIGVQLAKKGVEVLKGKNPGDIAWDYPRKFNLILNLKRAQAMNLTIPQELVSGAYRIYTDYDGNYIGQGK